MVFLCIILTFIFVLRYPKKTSYWPISWNFGGTHGIQFQLDWFTFQLRKCSVTKKPIGYYSKL